jgi:hypothetical protein
MGQIRDGILVGDLASAPTNADRNPALPPGRRAEPPQS